MADYEAKKKPKITKLKKQSDQNNESTHVELEAPMVREFAIHIIQSIAFLQSMDPIKDEEVEARKVTLKL